VDYIWTGLPVFYLPSAYCTIIRSWLVIWFGLTVAKLVYGFNKMSCAHSLVVASHTLVLHFSNETSEHIKRNTVATAENIHVERFFSSLI